MSRLGRLRRLAARCCVWAANRLTSAEDRADASRELLDTLQGLAADAAPISAPATVSLELVANATDAPLYWRTAALQLIGAGPVFETGVGRRCARHLPTRSS
jgi:hypothetical protein